MKLSILRKNCIIFPIILSFLVGCKQGGSSTGGQPQGTQSSPSSSQSSQPGQSGQPDQSTTSGSEAGKPDGQIQFNKQFDVVAERILKVSLKTPSFSSSFHKAEFTAEGISFILTSPTDEKIYFRWDSGNNIKINNVMVGKMEDYIQDVAKQINSMAQLAGKVKAELVEIEDLNLTRYKFE